MLSFLSHFHTFRCSRPGQAPIYLASQPTVTGTVNTDRFSFHGCDLRTARLNDNCRPHPTTVAAAPYHPHRRPPDVPAHAPSDTVARVGPAQGGWAKDGEAEEPA